MVVPDGAVHPTSSYINISDSATCPNGFVSLGIQTQVFGPSAVYLSAYSSCVSETHPVADLYMASDYYNYSGGMLTMHSFA